VLYNKEQLIGQQVIAVVNFPPKQIGKIISQCLVLGLVGMNNEVVLLQPQQPVKNGNKVL
jgi:tRNA-binding protein